MLNLGEQGIKAQITQWITRFKKFRDMFSTAKDVYNDLLGIDLDDSSVLLLQLRNPLGVARVSHAEMIDLPAGIITDDKIIDNAGLVAAIKKMIQSGGIKSTHAVIAIPGSKVAIKQVKLTTRLSDTDAEARAWQEARKTFPEIAKILHLDFTQIEEPGLDKDKKFILIIIVVRKEDIVPRVDALQQAGISTKIVDVDYYALERAYSLFASALPATHVAKYTALIDFNPHSILFVVMHKKKAVYFNRQNYTGDILVPLAQRAMGLEIAPMKSKPGILTPMRTIPMQLQSHSEKQTETTVNTLNEEQKSHVVMSIRRLFQSFYAENLGKTIEHIVITGRCALIPDFVHNIEKMLDIPTIIGNPLTQLKMGEQVSAERMISLGPAFALSCGLAMRGVPIWI